MRPHPISEIFPAMEGAEFQALVDDIEKNGVRQPLVMYQGKILDGRNRAKACDKLGIKPKTVDYRGDDPVGFVLSLNLTRRHLNESQRAMVAAKLTTFEHGGVRSKSSKEDLKPSITQGQAATRLNVSKPSVERAAKVIKEGTKALAKAVESGDVPVAVAAKIATAPAEVQREAVKDHGKSAPAIAKRVEAEKKETKPDSSIKTMGLEVPATVLERAEKEQAIIDKLDRLIAEINRTYTEYEAIRGGRNGLRTGQHYASALRDAVTAFKSIRGNRPASVCPHCKLWPELQKTCAACRCSGFVGEADLAHVEKVLLVEGDEAGVWMNGQWRTLISLRGDDF
jgi:hypothetical protein